MARHHRFPFAETGLLLAATLVTAALVASGCGKDSPDRKTTRGKAPAAAPEAPAPAPGAPSNSLLPATPPPPPKPAEEPKPIDVPKPIEEPKPVEEKPVDPVPPVPEEPKKEAGGGG